MEIFSWITGGGVVELSDRLFVGGFYWPDSHPYTRDFAFYNPAGSRPCGHIEDVSVSTGRFQVVDGTLKMMRGTSFKDSIVVGSMGTGYFDIGSNGVVNASNFTLSNNVMSQLSFKFGKNGIGKINASETFTIASGAKLSIDTTEYAGQKLGFRLVEAGNMVGAFDLDDIEILCTKGLPASCYQDDAGLSVKFFVGTIIMLK